MGSVTIQPAVRQETGKIAAGVGVLSVLTAAVYLILGRFNYTVLLGLLLGMAFAIGNFFLMALTVQHAAEKMNGAEVPAEPETEDGEEPPQQELSPQAKQAKNRAFAERLFAEGGPAVDQVTKLFGTETARRLILRYMYGVRS